MNNKECFMEMLGRVAPDLPLDDEEAVYGRILDDYASYAEMIEETSQQAEEQTSQPTFQQTSQQTSEQGDDGVPLLSGVNLGCPPTFGNSIFDIALRAV